MVWRRGIGLALVAVVLVVDGELEWIGYRGTRVREVYLEAPASPGPVGVLVFHVEYLRVRGFGSAKGPRRSGLRWSVENLGYPLVRSSSGTNGLVAPTCCNHASSRRQLDEFGRRCLAGLDPLAATHVHPYDLLP